MKKKLFSPCLSKDSSRQVHDVKQAAAARQSCVQKMFLEPFVSDCRAHDWPQVCSSGLSKVQGQAYARLPALQVCKQMSSNIDIPGRAP